MTQEKMDAVYAKLLKWMDGDSARADFVLELAIDKCVPSLEWLLETGEITGNLKTLISEAKSYRPRKVKAGVIMKKDMQFRNIKE